MFRLDYRRYKRPLIITPHPDDLEGFTGGLAYLLPNNLISMIFAGGNQGIWEKVYASMSCEDYISTRLSESKAAAKILGVAEVIYMGYYDRGVVVNEASIQQALNYFRLFRPDLVISFEYHKKATPYPHPDHLAVANIVRHAVARYEYNMSLDYYVCSTLLPNRFVDVSEVRREKLKALACHVTQRDLISLIFPVFERLFSRIWGFINGVDYAEGYRQVHIPTMMKRLKTFKDSFEYNELLAQGQISLSDLAGELGSVGARDGI